MDTDNVKRLIKLAEQQMRLAKHHMLAARDHCDAAIHMIEDLGVACGDGVVEHDTGGISHEAEGK